MKNLKEALPIKELEKEVSYASFSEVKRRKAKRIRKAFMMGAVGVGLLATNRDGLEKITGNSSCTMGFQGIPSWNVSSRARFNGKNDYCFLQIDGSVFGYEGSGAVFYSGADFTRSHPYVDAYLLGGKYTAQNSLSLDTLFSETMDFK